ncbi:unnamed protein product [Calicophoron daubneyi]|uniref:4'-phosphopantetheine phosphatase n=1 Tax=Calicophoron daubneyi TaxID=300641 RepID=A0AAV2T8J6_CALDB
MACVDLTDLSRETPKGDELHNDACGDTHRSDQKIPKVFGLDIGGSLAKLVYERTFLYKRTIPCPKGKQTTNADGPASPRFDFYDYQEREHEGHRVCLIKFETRRINEWLEFIRKNIADYEDTDPNEGGTSRHSLSPNDRVLIKVTGGGAYKYRDLISQTLGVRLDKEDEMECLVSGCVFMLRNIPDELFYYDKSATPSHVFISNALTDTFPFLMVNIGSGVSILKVESPKSFTRVGGSSIGGGTFWGIGSLFSGGKHSFDELLALADQGDHRAVDMLVRDIYGGDYAQLGLPGTVIASSFGQAARCPDRPRCLADMIKALLITVSNNIGQLACLYAKQHNLTRILFSGFFIRGHDLTMEVITYAVKYWSGGAFRAVFLRHEGYLGAVGAYLKALDQLSSSESRTIWAESYVSTSKDALAFAEELRVRSRKNSSASGFDSLDLDHAPNTLSGHKRLLEKLKHLVPYPTKQEISEDGATVESMNLDGLTLTGQEEEEGESGITTKMVMDSNYHELDRVFSSSLEPFPLLESPTTYVPDTWDLTQDGEARSYWLSCLARGIERSRMKAEESQIEKMSDATERSKQYAERYIAYLAELGQNPITCGVLSVRSLLSAQQHFLREFGFGDPYCMQKKIENQSALASLPSRLSDLSKLDWKDRQFSLVMGLLAGNVFDWGATDLVKFFAEAPVNEFGVPELKAALNKVQTRPWLIDGYDKWLEAISSDLPGPHYRCVLVFCDNSGADILLGVLPLALELLDQGSKVILAANSSPAINDVTFQELEILIRVVASFVPKVADALSEERLILAENGQTSPCLDLRLTATSLVKLIKQEKVDLIIIEGMGRAIHTNLHARFRVDCLKVAVIKNTWLADRLGGELYGVVFKFEPASTSETDERAEATESLSR